MNGIAADSGDWKSLHETELQALAARPGARVERTMVGERRVWVKRVASERRSFAKRLHALVSPLLFSVHLRASPALDADGLARRETRKAERFRAAGFPAPEVLWHDGSVLVLSDMGLSIKARLAKGSASAGAALIVECAGTLGRLHSAGLCHGRPHLRDMCMDERGRIGFLDFEEEPEAVMPLAAAQARDLWQFFLHASGSAPSRNVLEAALDAYRAAAPADGGPLSQVRPLLRIFRPAAALGALLPAAFNHHDLQRIAVATNFLQSAV